MKTTLTWVGGEHDFDLRIGELRAIQSECDAGPMEIINALAYGSWRVDMPMSVLRHGLIGGGMDAKAARELVDRMFSAHPIGRFVVPAQYVLAAAVVGVEGDPVGEPEGATMTPPPES
ncbi:gene transfer agent family protein [Frigidibacter sp. MR17.24]|uniref:gene transfer agent family protein n=1 Tax=Frigidibacter sp. MR17.24 TaxID=3127345 RepID=UPI003012C09A